MVYRPVAVPIEVGDRGDREGPHDEQVVVVVPFKPEFGLVGIDTEFVVARAALDDQRSADAGAQPASRGRDHVGEHVLRQKSPAEGRCLFRPLDSFGAKDLTDLEAVGTCPTLQRDNHRGVVRIEGIVAAHALDDDSTVEPGIVVDAGDFVKRLVILDRIDIGRRLAVNHGHIGWPVRHLAWQLLRRAQKEQIVG